MTDPRSASNSLDTPGALVHLRPGKGQPFYARHPWVLDSAILRLEGEPLDGQVVELISEKGKFIAWGIYNSRSRIRVRLYSWDREVPIGPDFWKSRLQLAINWRKQLGYDNPQGATRLVYSEGDGLSGIIVDRYANYLTVQVTSLALAARLPLLVNLLSELTQTRGIVLRTESGVARVEGLELQDGPYSGDAPDGPIFVEENGLKFGVDLVHGHKTGFYLDQRENRKAAASYLHNKRVLDLFCYTGGFSLAAAKLGQAREVVGIDRGDKALNLARANAQLNGIANVKFELGDGFDTLDAMKAENEKFDAVILDPPKFARSIKHVDDALRAYHRLNRIAVDILAPGGILITCSCSGSVTRDDFLFTLVGVGQKSKREIQVLEQRGAAVDHPINLHCLETEYLKCFICRVL